MEMMQPPQQRFAAFSSAADVTFGFKSLAVAWQPVYFRSLFGGWRSITAAEPVPFLWREGKMDLAEL